MRIDDDWGSHFIDIEKVTGLTTVYPPVLESDLIQFITFNIELDYEIVVHIERRGGKDVWLDMLDDREGVLELVWGDLE